jgi:hypothetical protein
MFNQTDLMLVEEFSEQELESVSGGQNSGLIVVDVSNVANNNDIDIIRDVKVNLNAAVAVLGRAGAAQGIG